MVRLPLPPPVRVTVAVSRQIIGGYVRPVIRPMHVGDGRIHDKLPPSAAPGAVVVTVAPGGRMNAG